MDRERKDDLLALLQIEAQHRQRIDSIWTQFKDAVLIINSAMFAILASLIQVPGLDAAGKIAVVAVTVAIEIVILFPARRDVERSAAEVEADYVRDYRAVTGIDPPRPLYSRALKMRKVPRRTAGNGLLPSTSGSTDNA